MLEELLLGIQNSAMIKSGHLKLRDQMARLFDKLIESPGSTPDGLRNLWPTSEGVGMQHGMVLAITSLVSAIHLSREGRDAAAWTFVVDARHYITAHEAFAGATGCLIETKAHRQSSLLDARHHENRDMKKYVIRWYEEHRSTGISKDKAAEAMAGVLVSASARTIRGWLINV